MKVLRGSHSTCKDFAAGRRATGLVVAMHPDICTPVCIAGARFQSAGRLARDGWPVGRAGRNPSTDRKMTTRKKTPEQFRSARWFAPDDLRSFGHRSRTMQMGYAPEEWKDRPIIAILNTWSDAQPCHMHFKSRVD